MGNTKKKNVLDFKDVTKLMKQAAKKHKIADVILRAHHLSNQENNRNIIFIVLQSKPCLV